MPGGRLGCLDTIEAIVTDQCGGPRICALTNISSVEFNRILDDVSTATVIVPISTGVSTNKPCCDCLDIIEPWCHELHIIRNGEEVWTGPIINITYANTQVTVEAADVLAWTQVRVPQGVLDNTTQAITIAPGSAGVNINTFVSPTGGTLFVTDASGLSTEGGTITIQVPSTTTPGTLDTRTLSYKAISGNSLTGVISSGGSLVLTSGQSATGTSNGDEITDLALDVLETAFNEHDPCVLEYVFQTDLNERPTTFANTLVTPENFPAFEGTVYEWLESLSEIGLDYTVLGRRVILGITAFNIQTLGTLTDQHILGEVEVTKNGWNMVNRAFVRYEQDNTPEQCLANNPVTITNPCPAIAEAANLRREVGDTSSVCYGPIERVFSDGVPFDYNTAKQTADEYVRQGSIAPRSVDLSGGTKLSPDTPWEFNDMVPGQQINVALNDLCLDVFQSMKLIEVNYSLTVGEDESISVSLGQLNSILGDSIGSL